MYDIYTHLMFYEQYVRLIITITFESLPKRVILQIYRSTDLQSVSFWATLRLCTLLLVCLV